MKVVCINETYKGHSMDLTYGKVYKVIDQVLKIHWVIKNDTYQIINDKGSLTWYDREVVITMDEWRNKQLNELGIC